jgi:hypothetical protein
MIIGISRAILKVVINLRLYRTSRTKPLNKTGSANKILAKIPKAGF